jgi:hypothetical protein
MELQITYKLILDSGKEVELNELEMNQLYAKLKIHFKDYSDLPKFIPPSIPNYPTPPFNPTCNKEVYGPGSKPYTPQDVFNPFTTSENRGDI